MTNFTTINTIANLKTEQKRAHLVALLRPDFFPVANIINNPTYSDRIIQPKIQSQILSATEFRLLKTDFLLVMIYFKKGKLRKNYIFRDMQVKWNRYYNLGNLK